jgi:hypothetical protein
MERVEVMARCLLGRVIVTASLRHAVTHAVRWRADWQMAIPVG